MRAILAALVLAIGAQEAQRPTVLVYTRNGPTLDGKKGYVHDNIAACVQAIAELGREHGFATLHSEDPALFAPESLRRFRAVVFANSNNRAFDTEEQRKAFQAWFRAGGGFAGVHSACGSERDWAWYWSLVGGTFARHPKFQRFTMTVADRKHPSTAHLEATWSWEDEFYYLRERPEGLHVLLEGQLETLDDPQKPKGEASRPLAWCREFEGGRAWTTTLGHKKEAYADPVFRKHLLGGIRWALRAE
jgi:type 1 glutamine amidotransferase